MKLYLTKLGIAILAIFAPIQPMLLSTFGLILADLLTGIIAARKRSEPINSKGLQRTIGKLFIYEIAIICAFIAQHFLMSDSIQITAIIAGYIGLTETVSILENLNTISGTNLLQSVLDKLGNSNKSDKP
jgi:phage-related holin